MKSVNFDSGWDYVVKLVYSSSQDGPILISQVEKIILVKYGHKSELVLKHKQSDTDRSYVGLSGGYQELRIPLNILNAKTPTDISFLFMEGNGMMSTDYEKHCSIAKASMK